MIGNFAYSYGGAIYTSGYLGVSVDSSQFMLNNASISGSDYYSFFSSY